MNHSPLTEDRELCALEQHSFSDEAASLIRTDHPQLRMTYAPNINGVWKSISERGGLGMIPLENSSGGVVWPHLERLMSEEQLQIAAAVRLQVRMCAGGLPDTDPANITHVHSHPKGLEQCTKYISSLSPSVEKIESGSTVAGAGQVAALQNRQHIALASRSAITAMGLTVLAEDIADLPGEQNVTKFLVIHKNGGQKLPITDMLHHAALITPAASDVPGHQRGVLARILNQVDTCGINLDSIHSRSVGAKDYAFFLEMEREGTPDEMSVLAQWLKHSSSIKNMKWLGSWEKQYSNTDNP